MTLWGCEMKKDPNEYHVKMIKQLAAKAATMPPGPKRQAKRFGAYWYYGKMKNPPAPFGEIYGPLDREHF